MRLSAVRKQLLQGYHSRMKSWANVPKEWRAEPVGASNWGWAAFSLFYTFIMLLSEIQQQARPWLIALYAFGGGLVLAAWWLGPRNSKRQLEEHKRELAEIAEIRKQLARYEHKYGMLDPAEDQ